MKILVSSLALLHLVALPSHAEPPRRRGTAPQAAARSAPSPAQRSSARSSASPARSTSRSTAGTAGRPARSVRSRSTASPQGQLPGIDPRRPAKAGPSGLPSQVIGGGVDLAATREADAAAVSEVVPAGDYLELVEIDRQENDAIKWDPGSGRFLYISTKEPPFLYLTGVAKPGYEISWQDQWIPQGPEGRIQIKVNVPLEPRVFRLKLFGPERTFRLMRFVNYWLKVPVSMRLRIREGNELVEKSLGYSSKYRSSSFVQLYSAERPVSLVDLDSQKHARLTFRIFPPPIPEEAYDRWRITVRDAEARVVGETSRLGAPPAYIDWRDISTGLFVTGRYTYRIDLYRGDTVYEGPANEFVSVEGLSVLDRPYLPTIQFEPREEIGYYAFRNHAGVTYSHFYVAADLSVVLWNRFLIRGVGLTSMHNQDPQNNFTFTRIGGGFRFNSRGESSILGHPYLSRVDVLLSHTAYTIYPTAPVRRYSQFALLVEPQLVLWRYHYVSPWLEFGTRPNFDQQRMSFGLNYYFFIRPWSVRFGMGVAYDWLFRFVDAPDMRFSTFRALMSFTAFL